MEYGTANRHKTDVAQVHKPVATENNTTRHEDSTITGHIALLKNIADDERTGESSLIIHYGEQ